MTTFLIVLAVLTVVVFVGTFAVCVWLAKWTTGFDPSGAWRRQAQAQTEALKRR